AAGRPVAAFSATPTRWVSCAIVTIASVSERNWFVNAGFGGRGAPGGGGPGGILRSRIEVRPVEGTFLRAAAAGACEWQLAPLLLTAAGRIWGGDCAVLSANGRLIASGTGVRHFPSMNICRAFKSRSNASP